MCGSMTSHAIMMIWHHGRSNPGCWTAGSSTRQEFTTVILSLVGLWLTRHRASTNMYSLTFSRSRYNTPRSMDEMEWRTQQACLLSGCRRGESLPACIVCDAVCGTGTACGQSGGLPLGSATHFHSVARATQPVHWLQIRPIVHN